MRKRVIRMKKRFPSEGPRKLRVYLVDKYPDERVPAASTIGLILKSEGLVAPRRRRRVCVPQSSSELTKPQAPNDVWCIDYKGEFRVGDQHCYPLTVTDLHSHCGLTVRGHVGANSKPVMRTLWNLFGKHGLPRVIRCDNGTPFVSMKAPAGMSRFGVMLARLGVVRERIAKGRPDQNGSHERFHRSLKAATANPPASTWAAQQRRFDRYLKHYNNRRPHEDLNMKPPRSAYRDSKRARPDQLPPIEHPRAQKIIPVYSSGEIGLRGCKLFLTATLAGETVAVNEIEEDLYCIGYGTIYLGVYSFRGKRPCFHQAP